MYRIIRGEMAKYNAGNEMMAKIIGASEVSFSKKMNGKTEFTLSEAKKILDFFNGYGNKYTLEYLFFTQLSPIRNDSIEEGE